eukprot:g5426.t1
MASARPLGKLGNKMLLLRSGLPKTKHPKMKKVRARRVPDKANVSKRMLLPPDTPRATRQEAPTSADHYDDDALGDYRAARSALGGRRAEDFVDGLFADMDGTKAAGHVSERDRFFRQRMGDHVKALRRRYGDAAAREFLVKFLKLDDEKTLLNRARKLALVTQRNIKMRDQGWRLVEYWPSEGALGGGSLSTDEGVDQGWLDGAAPVKGGIPRFFARRSTRKKEKGADGGGGEQEKLLHANKGFFLARDYKVNAFAAQPPVHAVTLQPALAQEGEPHRNAIISAPSCPDEDEMRAFAKHKDPEEAAERLLQPLWHPKKEEKLPLSARWAYLKAVSVVREMERRAGFSENGEDLLLAGRQKPLKISDAAVARSVRKCVRKMTLWLLAGGTGGRREFLRDIVALQVSRDFEIPLLALSEAEQAALQERFVSDILTLNDVDIVRAGLLADDHDSKNTNNKSRHQNAMLRSLLRSLHECDGGGGGGFQAKDRVMFWRVLGAGLVRVVAWIKAATDPDETEMAGRTTTSSFQKALFMEAPGGRPPPAGSSRPTIGRGGVRATPSKNVNDIDLRIALKPFVRTRNEADRNETLAAAVRYFLSRNMYEAELAAWSGARSAKMGADFYQFPNRLEDEVDPGTGSDSEKKKMSKSPRRPRGRGGAIKVAELNGGAIGVAGGRGGDSTSDLLHKELLVAYSVNAASRVGRLLATDGRTATRTEPLPKPPSDEEFRALLAREEEDRVKRFRTSYYRVEPLAALLRGPSEEQLSVHVDPKPTTAAQSGADQDLIATGIIVLSVCGGLLFVAAIVVTVLLVRMRETVNVMETARAERLRKTGTCSSIRAPDGEPRVITIGVR